MAGAKENDTENTNGNVEQTPTQSSTKSITSKPVKIKLEVIADDEDDEKDVVVEDKNRRKDLKAILTSGGKKSPVQKRETDDSNGDIGKVGSRRSSNNEGDAGMFSASVENEDAGSDDLSHDRYSPFEGICENSENDDFSPIQDQNGNVVLEVDCGSNSALLYVNKLCQGSKGQCILFEDRWYTPNEFQFISGRETAKDWKRSIRHRGKSLKILMGRGLLRAHPLMCECDTCRLNFASKGLRIGDRRGAVSTSSPSSNGSLAMVDRSRLRRTTGPDGEGGHLNDIIDQLQHSNNNGYSNGNHHHFYDSGRKRSLGVDTVSPTGSSPSSMPCGLALVKRPRSVSPRDDDIYDEQQRKIFEAANSPEPQNIENLRRSLNLSSSRSNSPSGGDRVSPSTGSHQSLYGSHGNGRNAPTVMVAASINNNNTSVANGAGPADLSRNSSTSPTSGGNATPTGLLISQAPQMMVKHQTKSRKQTAPQHLDVGNHGDEVHPHRSAHIILSNYSGQQYKANAAVRPRYQSTPVYNHRVTTNSSTNHHHTTGSSGELNLSTNGGSRRTHSAMTSSTRNPSQRAPGTPVKMIELTRPEIVPSSSSGYSSRPSSTHSSSNPGEEGRSHTPVHSSIGNTDAVFLPADITSWSISDVSHFVQSLKGCEDYSQVFQEQAIDGEILPVLTEDHLLHNMGLKLGPALKIRLHVARRLGFTLDGQYCNTSIPPPPPQHAPQLPPSSSSMPQESTGTPAPPGQSTPGTAGQKPASEVFTEDV